MAITQRWAVFVIQCREVTGGECGATREVLYGCCIHIFVEMFPSHSGDIWTDVWYQKREREEYISEEPSVWLACVCNISLQHHVWS